VLVVDTNVVVHLALRGALERLAPHDAAAPALLRSEVTSVLRELAWARELSDEQAMDTLASVEQAPITLAPAGSLDSAAYRLAARLGWKRTYDAEFLALAEKRGCGLVTSDARLARIAERTVGLVALETI